MDPRQELMDPTALLMDPSDPTAPTALRAASPFKSSTHPTAICSYPSLTLRLNIKRELDARLTAVERGQACVAVQQQRRASNESEGGHGEGDGACHQGVPFHDLRELGWEWRTVSPEVCVVLRGPELHLGLKPMDLRSGLVRVQVSFADTGINTGIESGMLEGESGMRMREKLQAELTVRLCPELQLPPGRELVEAELQGPGGAAILASQPLVLVICQYSEDLAWLRGLNRYDDELYALAATRGLALLRTVTASESADGDGGAGARGARAGAARLDSGTGTARQDPGGPRGGACRCGPRNRTAAPIGCQTADWLTDGAR